MTYGSYGVSPPSGERHLRAGLPVLLVGVGMCAMMAIATVAHLSNTSSTMAISTMQHEREHIDIS